MKTITATVKAWLPSHCGPQDLEESAEHAVTTLGFAVHDMTACGWVYVGMATITAEIVDGQALVDNKVKAVREEQRQARIKADMTDADFELKIQKLLAITNEVTQ